MQYDDTPILQIPEETGCATVPVVRLFVFALVALTSGTALSFWAHHTNQTQVVGVVKAPVYQIRSPQRAEVTEILVNPGEQVSPGKLAFRLSDQTLSQRIERKQQELALASQKLDQVQARISLEIASRERALETDIYTAKLNSARLQQEQTVAELQSLVWEDLLKQGESSLLAALDSEDYPSILSSLQTTSNGIVSTMLRKNYAEETEKEFEFQIELSEERVEGLKSASDTLRTQIERAEGLPAIQEKLDLIKDELATLEEQMDELEVHAEVHGEITEISVRLDDIAEKHSGLMTIADLDQRFVEVSIPSSLISRIDQGDELKIVFSGHRATVGTVKSIPKLTNGYTSAMQANDRAEVTVILIPDGALWPQVPVGSKVTVIID